MKKSVDELVNEYIMLATIEGDTKISGDYKKGNRISKKLSKIYNELENDHDIAIHVIGAVLKSSSERAKALAAADALRLGIFIEEAVDILTVISKRNDILGFSSEMTLKIWKGEISGKSL